MAIYYKVDIRHSNPYVMFKKIRDEYLQDDDYIWAMRRWGSCIGFGDRIPYLANWDHSRNSHHYILGSEAIPIGDVIVKYMNPTHLYSLITNWIKVGEVSMMVNTDNYYCEFAPLGQHGRVPYSRPPGATQGPPATVPGDFTAAVTATFGGNLMPADSLYALAYLGITEYVLSEVPSLTELPNAQEFAFEIVTKPELVERLVTSPQIVLHEVAAQVNFELTPEIEAAIVNEITANIEMFRSIQPV